MEPDLNLADHGDLLERDNADYVRERFPSLERIWSVYIGNNGRAEALTLVGAAEGELRRRDECSQRLYTILQSMVLMKQLCTDVDARDLPEFVSITTDDDRLLRYHLATVNDFMAFHAHAGRIRDCIKLLGVRWEDPHLAKDLNEVYQRRNNVLHGSAIPRGMVEGAMTILVPAGSSPKEYEWSARSQTSWRERRNDRDELVSTYMQETLGEVETAVHNALGRLESRIREFLQSKQLTLEDHVAAQMRVRKQAISDVSDPDVRSL